MFIGKIIAGQCGYKVVSEDKGMRWGQRQAGPGPDQVGSYNEFGICGKLCGEGIVVEQEWKVRIRQADAIF